MSTLYECCGAEKIAMRESKWQTRVCVARGAHRLRYASVRRPHNDDEREQMATALVCSVSHAHPVVRWSARVFECCDARSHHTGVLPPLLVLVRWVCHVTPPFTRVCERISRESEYRDGLHVKRTCGETCCFSFCVCFCCVYRRWTSRL